MKIKQAFTIIVKPFKRDITQEKLGDFPQKFLLSPILKESKESSPQEIKNNIEMDVQSKHSSFKIKRSEEYFVSQEKYKNFSNNHPHGKVHIFNYNDINFTLAGSQWEHIPNKNLYKLLTYTRPQAILLQIRPDQILKGFDYEYKSSHQYIDQITREPDEIMPVGYSENISRELGYENLNFLEYEPYINYERIGLDKIATIAYYAKKYQIKIILVDLPSLIFRETLCNQLTLPQLQEYFHQTTRATSQNPDILPNTPMNVAYQILPNIFLKRSDEYMTTIIEYLAAKKQYKKIFGIFGNMQSDSIVDLLENKKASHLKNELTIPKIKRTIFKQLTCEDLVERHAILDILYYGNINDEKYINFHDLYFPETNAIIKKYADPHLIDKTRIAQMKYLHLEMLKKYNDFADRNYEIGKEAIQSEYMEKAGLI